MVFRQFAALLALALVSAGALAPTAVHAQTCPNRNPKWSNINRFLCGTYIEWDYNVNPPAKDSLSWFYWTREHLCEALAADGINDCQNYLDRLVAEEIKAIPVDGGNGQPVGKYIGKAKFRIDKLDCDSLSILNAADVSLIPKLVGNQVTLGVLIKGVSAECYGKINVRNVDLKKPWYISWAINNYGGIFNFEVKPVTSKAQAITFKSDFVFSKTTFRDTLMPTKLQIPRPQCKIGLDAEAFRLSADGTLENIVLWLIDIIAPTLISNIACGYFSKAGELAAGKPGFLGSFLPGINNLFVDTATKPFTTAPESEALFNSETSEEVRSELVDFTDSVPFEVASAFINDVLGNTSATSDRLVINELFDTLTSNTAGRLDFTIIPEGSESEFILDGGYKATISDASATVRDANTITTLALLAPAIDPSTQQALKRSVDNDFRLEKITLGAAGAIQADADLPRRPGYSQQSLRFFLDASARVNSPKLNLTTLIAANLTELDDVYMGNVFVGDLSVVANQRLAFACASPAIHQLNLTKFELGYKEGEKPVLQVFGFIDTGFEQVFTDLNQAFTYLYGDAIEKHLPGLVRGQMGAANDYAYEALNKRKQSEIDQDPNALKCPNELFGFDPEAVSLIDFSSATGASIKKNVDKTLGVVDNPDFGINSVLKTLTNSLGTDVGRPSDISDDSAAIFVGEVYSLTLPVDGNPVLVSVKDVRFSGLNSFTKLDVLGPLGTRKVRNSVGLGGSGDARALNPLTMSVTFAVQTNDTFGVTANEEWMLTVAYHGMEVNADMHLEIDTNQMRALKFGQATNPACLMRAAQDAYFLSFNGTHKRTEVDLQCSGCSLREHLKKPAALSKMTLLTNSALSIMRQGITNQEANDAFSSLVTKFAATCETGLSSVTDLIDVPTLPPTEAIPEIGTQIVILTNLGAGLLIVAFLTFLVVTRSNGFTSSKSTSNKDDMMLSPMTAKSGGDLKDLTSVNINRLGPSMFLDPVVPAWFKYSFIGTSIGTLAMFLSANMYNGGSVLVEVTLENGSVINLGSVFDFTLTGSIEQMFAAKVESLGMLIALASGCWPYVKVVLTMFSFFAPPWLMAANMRGSLLSVMDLLGKWSIVDQFMMALLAIVFFIDVPVAPTDNPDWFLNDVIPEDLLRVRVRIVPDWGLYGFLIAALLSILISHGVLYYHQHILDHGWHNALEASGNTAAVRRGEAMAGRKIALRNHHFERQLSARQAQVIAGNESVGGRDNGKGLSGYKIRLSPGFSVFVLVVFAGAFFCVMVGAVLITFGFDLQGVGGLAMGWVQPGDDRVALSLFTAAGAITEQATDPYERLGLTFIQSTFVVVAFVMPVVRLVLFLVLWFTPLTLHAQKRVYRALTAASSWSGLEVFVGAVVAAYLNLERFADFMVQPYCQQINLFLREYGVASGLLTTDQATCFRVRTFIETAFIVPIVAVMLASLFNYIVARLCRAALEDREAFLKGCHSPYDVDPKSGIPKRQMRSFLFGLHDMTLVRLGLAKPILVMGGKADIGGGGGPMTGTATTKFSRGGDFQSQGSFNSSRQQQSSNNFIVANARMPSGMGRSAMSVAENSEYFDEDASSGEFSRHSGGNDSFGMSSAAGGSFLGQPSGASFAGSSMGGFSGTGSNSESMSRMPRVTNNNKKKNKKKSEMQMSISSANPQFGQPPPPPFDDDNF